MITNRSAPALVGAFLCGGILFGLTVVWFRKLILFVSGSGVAFAVMVSVVPAGLAAGGMAGSTWFRRYFGSHRYAGVVALANAVVVLVAYSFFGAVLALTAGITDQRVYVCVLSIFLMFPACFVSGVLFTLVGQIAYDEIGRTVETAGIITIVSAGGAAAGSALAIFVLVPGLGIEKALFGLACSYAAVALCLIGKRHLKSSLSSIGLTVAAVLLFAVAAGLFPFGITKGRILSVGSQSFAGESGSTPVACYEGLTETSQYWRRELFGKLVYTRLIANSHLAGGTDVASKRCANLSVYWPIAVHPNPRRALLICYGIGTTARALALTGGLTSIDVVDISRDILNRSQIAFPTSREDPLKDRRVRVHVEDCRFLLQNVRTRFDIIVGQPPSPEMAQAMNLYSQEYFRLMFDRLEEGGIATFRLPAGQIGLAGTKAIAKAFCNVFADCSLWNGSGYNWMLVGTRNAKGPVTAAQFARQWKDPAVFPELCDCGFEKPEQLGATFIMDSDELSEWTKHAKPLVDDQPHRISAGFHRFVSKPSKEDLDALDSMTNSADLVERFRSSRFVKQCLPERFIAGSVDYFSVQKLMSASLVRSPMPDIALNVASLHGILTETDLRFPVFLLIGGSPLVEIDRAIGPADAGLLSHYPAAAFHLGVRALAHRDYHSAAEYLGLAQEQKHAPRLVFYRVYALLMAGRPDAARELAAHHGPAFASDAGSRYLEWLATTFGEELPRARD